MAYLPHPLPFPKLPPVLLTSLHAHASALPRPNSPSSTCRRTPPPSVTVQWEVGSKAPPPPLRVALEASTSSLSMLTWLMARLDPARDPLLVVRLDGLEKDGTEPMQTTRLLATFANEAAARGFGVSKHAMAEGHVAGLPPLVLQERVDLLAVAAPSSKVTPPHVLELLRSARTNVLVWRPAIKQGVQALGA